MKKKITKADQIEIKEDKIIYHSKSGEKYEITTHSCSCYGFGFKQHCRHFDEVKKNGMLDQLKQKTVGKFTITKTPSIIAMRKAAIRTYLKNNKIKFTEKVIDKIESFLTPKTTAKKVLTFVRSRS